MNDRYLKAVLTVIAFALCWIAAEMTVRPAKADVVQAGAASMPLISAGTRARDVKPETQVVAVYCVNCESTR